ncbi:5-(carboxyamino)imidazole ribonucleotide synthase [Effusibacillus pohliae]|uniref:5-(carboxyamino)imidazole ribonucleotide synthase n=1 Tax=Effusibacillus pohliae TaxID=232270 RepID=UPI000375D9C0|nr:5-(carboxyamino)imidazole ribonucleotide synthase [Effusibacillus pohliae]
MTDRTICVSGEGQAGCLQQEQRLGEKERQAEDEYTGRNKRSAQVDGRTPRQILPGATIGILGGGQLGRMIALKAREMGYRIVTLDPAADSPCGQVADVAFTGPLDDLAIAREMARVSDVLTYEFENVSDELVQVLQREAYLPQGGEILRTTRHRIREKTALQAIGIPVAPWRPVGSREELRQAVAELGLPAVLKTATGGYDGKGQYVLGELSDIEKAWQTLGSAGRADWSKEETGVETQSAASGSELVLEGWVDFAKELSVIAARNPNGEVRTFPTAENIHRENILHQSIVPARIPAETDRAAQELAKRIAEELDVVGLIAVEMFWQEGSLLVNELAPRPHNSGHYTIDACATSQFEQHVRAICNLPLGETRLLTPVVMVNILGEHVEPVLAKANRLGDGIKLHLYGKAEAKRKRKMGHLNVLGRTVEEALAKIEQLGIWNG